MLLLKRIFTAALLFVPLFLVLFIGSMIVGGGMAGMLAGQGNPDAKDFQSGFKVGQQAGAEFSKNYGGIVCLSALGIAGVGACAISFSGIIPWCRRTAQPPRLP